ncbi:hypothetical protein F2Q70_00010319 [Brassica cretica]|uniref:Uncharacterized protein n=1 Tax=Brassica cretica TaxID=69181 RepID=A0A8S9M8J9_BRACR|nr:hypothetical protein F2Q70_00010319 [Brassica cretica]
MRFTVFTAKGNPGQILRPPPNGSSLLRYQLAVASHLRLGPSSSLSTQAWLVVVIELVFRPAAPDSPSSTPVVISVVAELQIEKNICLLSVTIHPKLSLTAF